MGLHYHHLLHHIRFSSLGRTWKIQRAAHSGINPPPLIQGPFDFPRSAISGDRVCIGVQVCVCVFVCLFLIYSPKGSGLCMHTWLTLVLTHPSESQDKLSIENVLRMPKRDLCSWRTRWGFFFRWGRRGVKNGDGGIQELQINQRPPIKK